VLLERHGCLGGMATAGLVGTVCGLYTSGDGRLEPVNEGPALEFGSELANDCGVAPMRMGRLHVQPYDAPQFARLCDRWAHREQTLSTRLHTHVFGVERQERRLVEVRYHDWNGAHRLAPRVVVDASGDAVTALAAGAATVTPDLAERQLMSLVFHVQNVRVEQLGRPQRALLLKELLAAEDRGALPTGAAALSLRATQRPGEVACKLALTGVGAATGAGRDPLSAAERLARERAVAVVEHLRATHPAFAAAFVSHLAPQVGVRESRRLHGRYTLTRDDVLAARRCADGIARGAWPIEIGQEGRQGPRLEYLADGQSYELPLRCFQARELDDYFVVGRCLSADHEAHGSARVIGTCLASGFAVGVAAARVANGAS
jgi:hypothetical protein